MSLYSKNKPARKGQSITEIGILGSLLVLILGALINYAVKNDTQQRVMQMTFRKALTSASHSSEDHQPYSVTHMVIRDVYVPEPGHIFGRGAGVPFSSSASVTWNYRLGDVPQTPDELPVMKIDIQGTKASSSGVIPLKTAGFSKATCVSEKDLNTIRSVFGAVFGWGHSGLCPTADGCWLDINDGGVDKSCSTGTIMGDCPDYSYSWIQVVDYCAGDIYDYATCKHQCNDLSGLTTGSQLSAAACRVANAPEPPPVISYNISKDISENNVLTTYPSRGANETPNWDEKTTRTINTTGDTVETHVGEKPEPERK